MQPLTVFYDEDCGLCRRGIELLRRWDKSEALRFAGIRSPRGARDLASVGPELLMRSWHVADGDGTTWSGGSAVPIVARRLRGGTPIARLAERVPRTTEWVYRWVAAHRAAIGRLLGEPRCATDRSARQ